MIEHKPCFGLEIVNDGFSSETMRTSMILSFKRLFKPKDLIKGSKNTWKREWCTKKGCLGRGRDIVERGRQLNRSNEVRIEVLNNGLRKWICRSWWCIISGGEVMEEALEQSFGLLEFWGLSSFNWRELVHVGNGIKSVVFNEITTWVDPSSLIWRHHELMMDPREEEDRDWDEDHNFFREMR
ncbi:hypothetical protein Tco_0677858 [Tanacetum coccineum]|uniref:Uncharacterized protein n=1 Tax=Tanacetum coccineum TaxID=301880 RepID=A0ABQ4XDF7_9ASTR